jgi:hypothetical protein
VLAVESCRVNCPFYFKVGACRHGDRCSRQHNKPLFSQTVLLAHMYQAPNSTTVQTGPTSMLTAADDVPAQEHFDEFFEEVKATSRRPQRCVIELTRQGAPCRSMRSSNRSDASRS